MRPTKIKFLIKLSIVRYLIRPNLIKLYQKKNLKYLIRPTKIKYLIQLSIVRYLIRPT